MPDDLAAYRAAAVLYEAGDAAGAARELEPLLAGDATPKSVLELAGRDQVVDRRSTRVPGGHEEASGEGASFSSTSGRERTWTTNGSVWSCQRCGLR